ncbi:MAG: efflux RND transporter permease subunit [Ruminiclostridium sp.]|nr:efflux RND transporter permease subunit [Ruminiclostridium sp.]
MDIASFCIKHKVTTILAYIIIAIFGVVFFTNLKLSLMPNMEFPAAYVLCTYPGASPSDMESLVTRPLESCVASVTGVEDISSTSSENVSIVMITYEDGTDVDEAAIKLREKFDTLTLPTDCSDPIIYNFNVNDMMPLAVIALDGSDLNQLQKTADDHVIPALERIEGVAAAAVSGGVSSQITVAVNTTAMNGYGLTMTDISNYLAAANILYPAGDMQNGTNTLSVTTNGKYQSIEDVANTILFLPTGGTIRLSEIATVYLDSALQDSSARVNDHSSVVLTVNKQSGSNEVDVMNRVSETLEELHADIPSMNYFITYDSSDYIKNTVYAALQNILTGVALAALVVYFFLRRLGATATISLSMPLCVVAVMLMLNVCDITLNMISMGAIAVCVGMVVDNSIVVLENIYRYAGDGYNRYDSCVLGTKEVVLPITASSLTTIAVFLPIGLAGGLAGMVFRDFAMTVVFLIVFSLVVALTLVPLMCYFLLEENKVRLDLLKDQLSNTKWKTYTGILSAKYMKLLNYCLEHQKKTLLAAVVVIMFFLACCLGTNVVLLPDMDQGMVNINVSMPTGTELETTDAYCDRIISIAQENCPEISSLYATNEAESSSITLTLVPNNERKRTSEEVADSLRGCFDDIAGCEIEVSAYSMVSMLTGTMDIQVAITGADYDVLSQVASDLTTSISALESTVDVENSVEKTIPAVTVDINPSAASQYFLTTATIGAAVRAELTGTTATSVTVNGNDLDVVVQGSGVSAQSLDALRSMPIPIATGGTIPLSSVANVYVELSPQSITRSNQSRQVEITGSTVGGNTMAVTKEIKAIIDEYPMPEGYKAIVGGSYAEIMENFRSLGLALIVAIGLVYFILASQFESFLMPVIVMMILPVALSGAMFGLPITGQDISMIVLLGLIMLTGTVVNNSIVLVDYINVRREAGQEREQAILEACPLRVRPIMMTTMTTVLALLPMAFGLGGEGSELLIPLGVVMIFGMMIATVVTLVFTPVCYSLLDDLSIRAGKPMQERRNRKNQELLREIEAAEYALQAVSPPEPIQPEPSADDEEDVPPDAK